MTNVQKEANENKLMGCGYPSASFYINEKRQVPLRTRYFTPAIMTSKSQTNTKQFILQIKKHKVPLKLYKILDCSINVRSRSYTFQS